MQRAVIFEFMRYKFRPVVKYLRPGSFSFFGYCAEFREEWHDSLRRCRLRAVYAYYIFVEVYVIPLYGESLAPSATGIKAK